VNVQKKEAMLILQNISYTHPDKEVLFTGIHLTAGTSEKIALIGSNGSGKSTLLKVIAGELSPSAGYLKADAPPYSVPQIFGQYNHLTIAQALGIEAKYNALQEILAGRVTAENMGLLQEGDWMLEERCTEALVKWGLPLLPLSQRLHTLSGGQKTSVFLAGITLHQPKLILLDEPSNHLDGQSRKVLYEFIRTTRSTLLIVSHDRKLLNLLSTVCELSPKGITAYGGNYNFYLAQKQVEQEALQHHIQASEKALRQAKEKARKEAERQQKLDARGRGKQEKSGVSRIMFNTLRNQAEASTSKIKQVHADKTAGLAQELQSLRKEQPAADAMKLGFDTSTLHQGKVLFQAQGINFSFAGKILWTEGLNFEIRSGDRIALKGSNGAGKTTLIRALLELVEATHGTLVRTPVKAIYIDQEYALMHSERSVFEQAFFYNEAAREEHEIKTRLARFLFFKDDWDKSCSTLSGGERMRLALCILTLQNQSPDLLILDEPTNNLDLQNIEILTEAIRDYAGTLLVVSHDETFLEQMGINGEIVLQRAK
jgi:ATPase subunit of ABC transporter with duplicated ATPase domains